LSVKNLIVVVVHSDVTDVGEAAVTAAVAIAAAAAAPAMSSLLAHQDEIFDGKMIKSWVFTCASSIMEICTSWPWMKK
jgi:hypothetical protein